MHSILSRGIENWAEALYLSVFGTTKALESFIHRVQENEEDKINESKRDE
jgi:hypothetical protein